MTFRVYHVSSEGGIFFKNEWLPCKNAYIDKISLLWLVDLESAKDIINLANEFNCSVTIDNSSAKEDPPWNLPKITINSYNF